MVRFYRISRRKAPSPSVPVFRRTAPKAPPSGAGDPVSGFITPGMQTPVFIAPFPDLLFASDGDLISYTNMYSSGYKFVRGRGRKTIMQIMYDTLIF